MSLFDRITMLKENLYVPRTFDYLYEGSSRKRGSAAKLDWYSDDSEARRKRSQRQALAQIHKKADARANAESDRLGHDARQRREHIRYHNTLALNPHLKDDPEFHQDHENRLYGPQKTKRQKRGGSEEAWDTVVGGKRGRRFESESLYDRHSLSEGGPPGGFKTWREYAASKAQEKARSRKKLDKSIERSDRKAREGGSKKKPRKNWRREAESVVSNDPRAGVYPHRPHFRLYQKKENRRVAHDLSPGWHEMDHEPLSHIPHGHHYRMKKKIKRDNGVSDKEAGILANHALLLTHPDPKGRHKSAASRAEHEERWRAVDAPPHFVKGGTVGSPSDIARRHGPGRANPRKR